MKIRDQVHKSCEMGLIFKYYNAFYLRVRKELLHFAPTGYCTHLLKLHRLGVG